MLLINVRDEDVDGEIRGFPNCKMGKRNQLATSGCSDICTADTLGYSAVAPQ